MAKRWFTEEEAAQLVTRAAKFKNRTESLLSDLNSEPVPSAKFKEKTSGAGQIFRISAIPEADSGCELQSKGRNSKYNAEKVIIDGFRFDSKLEGAYYLHLKLLQQAGEVAYFLRQVPFHLPGNVTYRADFLVFYTSGVVEYVDVKGKLTKEFIRAKKQVEALYPVIINVVKRGEF